MLVIGCANFSSDIAAAPALTTIGHLTGTVHGGRQPIAGAHVYLFAAGTGGYGTASTSLLNAVSTGSFPTTKDAADNNYYVTSDPLGNFDISAEYTCTPGSQVYLYALGGDPGSGSSNSAAGLLAILGTCGTDFNASTIVRMNEVSTVAAAYSFAAFATDATHVASTNTPLALTNIANAFATAANIYDISGGSGDRARLIPKSGSGSVPQTEIHSLANSLAACINSTSSASSQCSTLFAIKSAGTTGTTPTDTATVAINIAHNPTTSVAAIWGNTVGIGTPFLPTLTTAPLDYSVALSFYNGALGFPEFVAIDASGDVWVSCYSSGTAKYLPNGGTFPGGGSYSGGGLNHGIYIAIDTSGNAWIANQTGGSVTEFGPSGTVKSPSTGFKGNNDLDPAGIAIDATGNIWVSNSNKNTLSKLDNLGNELAGSPYTPGGLNQPWQIAIDGAGNIWSGNYNSTNIMEVTSAGAAAGTAPFFTGSYATPRSVVIGAGGKPWVSNYTGNSITMVTAAGVGTNISGSGISRPSDAAVDGAGNVWVANQSGNSLSAFASDGTPLFSTLGYQAGGALLNQPYGLAVDGAGNIWIANASGDNLVEFIGAATPTITPLVAAVAANAIGTRP
ncbi:MAG: NHL repeat-containing protein [Acidobacteriota bacterium]